MTKYKPYPKYKDSGIEWLEEIPEHWEVKKIKFLTKNIQTGSTPPTSKEEYFYGDINWFTPGDFKDQLVLTNSKRKLSEKAIQDKEAKLYKKETLLLVGIGATIGKVGWTVQESYFNQQITALIFKNDEISKFYTYQLYCLISLIRAYANFTTLPIINNEGIKIIPLITPEKECQKQIVSFLDKETTKLDTLITKKTQLIELLKEKRQATITQAVTKGLDKNVKMKDSGIDWLGEIPEHWVYSKIKYTTYVKGRIGWQGLRSDEFIDEGPYLVTGTDFIKGLINWKTCYHILEERYNEAPPIQLKENDLLITKDGTIGKVAIVKNKPDKAIVNSGVFVTRPLKDLKYTTGFMYWLLLSDVFYGYIKYSETGSTIKHLYQDTFVNFLYPLPTLKEQETISNFLDQQTSKIDTLISKIDLHIEKLKEYRQALISAAVTGKIDVRDQADSQHKEHRDEATQLSLNYGE